MTPDHVRAGEDFETVARLRDELGALFPPVVYCLNKVDTHLSPGGDWPPETNPRSPGISRRTWISSPACSRNRSRRPSRKPATAWLRVRFRGERRRGPDVRQRRALLERRDPVVVDRRFLPISARLQFNQAQRRERLMRKMAGARRIGLARSPPGSARRRCPSPTSSF
ncbi:hypothetical protein D8S78_14805 [Natrialba swarupiae]|nr:hypothetical protein [Natrialba swarupiae]